MKRKKRKLKRKTIRWLVTVCGHESAVFPPQIICTKVIKLPKDTDPVDWFLTKPKVYHRTEFVPTALISFLELDNEKKQTTEE